jgi:tetratricopeptide (TPR) repeat protein
MKKTVRIILFVGIIFLTSSQARADSPYTTWGLGPGGGIVLTQDAYSPYAELDLPISGAEDMFATPDGIIYIADTGNRQIVKLQDFEVVATYGNEVLEGPSGIFVDDEGIMYIADAQKNSIVILDKDGELINEFGRPTEPLFGLTQQFLPRKVIVDARKNLFIINEGSVNGIVQMNTNGNFIGYFGANASSMSLKMILQRMFLTQEQLDQFIKNVAASPSNITIDHQAMVYTITAGTDRWESIRKFTVSGKNIFPDTYGSSTFRDIDVSEDGLVVAVDSNGRIHEYDLNGTILFVFGAQDTGEQRLGTLVNPTAIERFQEFLYVLDKDKNAIVIYQTTAFAEKVHAGVRLFMDGFYQESKPYFEEVLDFNGSFIMSYQAIADAYFKEGNYKEALAAYKFGENRVGYSQTFWELRNLALQQFLSQAILGVVGFAIVLNVGTRLERRYKWFDPIRKWLVALRRLKLVDDFIFMFRFIKEPADSFYNIKKKYNGSLLFAGLIYVWIVLVRVLSLYITGFVFNPFPSPVYIQFEYEITVTIVALFLWNAANYLVSTISDGEGRIRDVIIGSAYSMFPYVLFALPIAILSNVLTLNEVFIYSFSMDIIWFWVGLMLFIMVKEIHNYSFWETVRNVIITLFTIALFLLTGYIIFILFTQLFDFISAIVQEVGLRG